MTFTLDPGTVKLWVAVLGLLGTVVATVGGFYFGKLKEGERAQEKFGKDIAYIKGQLSQLMTIHDHHQKLRDKHAGLEKEHGKTRTDLNRAFERIKSMEGRFTADRPI